MLNQSQRQLYRPVESPYEPNVGGQRPNDAYPLDSDYPVTTAEPGFLLGTLGVEMPGCFDLLAELDVFFRKPLVDTDAQQGIITGDLTSVGNRMVDFFWLPVEFYPVVAYPVTDRQLTLTYRDYAAKHPDLRRPYTVTFIIEYVEKHPDVEAIDDPVLRARIYADLLNSDFSCISIDPEKYRKDPAYSAVAELRESYRHFFDPTLTGGPSVEATILTSLTN